MKKLIYTVVALLFPFAVLAGNDGDTLRRIGFSLNMNPGKEVRMDKYLKKITKGLSNYSFTAELHHVSLPQDSDAFASDYGYPTLTLGAKYSFNHGVTFHRNSDPFWGLAQEVDYDSRLGNSFTLYGTFARPFFRHDRWETDYSLSVGVGYMSHKYNPVNNIDNELIGSRWLIYFGAGLHVSYRFAPNWGIRGGVEYWHLSNGALNRPNKGANFLGPVAGIVYEPYYEDISGSRKVKYNPPFEKYLYFQFSFGTGIKTLHEDWHLTQFETQPGDKDYRTDKFKHYACYSFQTDLMYRYARRWASGIGFDVFYGNYASRCRELDEAKGYDVAHSPWSVAIAGKHEVFYHHLSVAMELGAYLYREMGVNARATEKRYFECVGLRYTFPSLGGLQVGFNVKAHLAKADYTELVVGYPIVLKRYK